LLPVFHVLCTKLVTSFTKVENEKIQLVLPNELHKTQYLEMMKEWLSFGGRLHSPALRNNGASYEKWLDWMKDDQYE
jgi:predicted acetyltransferase